MRHIYHDSQIPVFVIHDMLDFIANEWKEGSCDH